MAGIIARLSSFLDWLQSLEQFFINVSYTSTCSQSNSDGSEPSELDWLQVLVYDMTV